MRAKPVLQKRSQEKRDRILDALDRLLKSRPYSDLGVADLAREADVSPATLYQRFRNADVMGSVLLELYYRRVEEWSNRPRRGANAAVADLRGALKQIALDTWDMAAALSHVMRPAYLYSCAYPDRVGPEWARLKGRAVQGFAAFVASRSNEIAVADQDRAAALLARLHNLMLVGLLLHEAMGGRGRTARREAFAEDLSTLASRYLCSAK